MPTFLESGGLVVVEAESNASSAASATGGRTWAPVADGAAVGGALQASGSGGWTDAFNEAELAYDIEIVTAGTYYFHVRHRGTSASGRLNVRIDGVALSPGASQFGIYPAHIDSSGYGIWSSRWGSGGGIKCSFELAAGTYTLRIQPVNGTATIDRWLLTTDSSASYNTAGPAESATSGGASADEVAPTLGTAPASGFAPTIATSPAAITPALGTASATGFAPTLSPASRTLAPTLGTAPASGFSPAVSTTARSITPPLGTAATSGFAPTLTEGIAGAVDVRPGLGTAQAVGFDPIVTTTAHPVTPARGTAAASGFAPTLTRAAHQVSVALGTAAATGFDPQVGILREIASSTSAVLPLYASIPTALPLYRSSSTVTPIVE